MSLKAVKIILGITIPALVIVCFWCINVGQNRNVNIETTNFDQNLTTITINNTLVKVEIANTPEERNQGLSGRKLLPEGQGMLFVFDRKDYYSFWMKDMFIPLDFIWISDNQIVELNENIKPEDFQPPNSLTPRTAVNKVLEVNAGFIDKNQIKVGDLIKND